MRNQTLIKSIAVLLLVSLLAGCGGKKDAQETTAAEWQETTFTAQTAPEDLMERDTPEDKERNSVPETTSAEVHTTQEPDLEETDAVQTESRETVPSASQSGSQSSIGTTSGGSGYVGAGGENETDERG